MTRSMLLGAALLAAAGCAPGYNRTLFVTTTNLGLDVSNTPPTFELALSRVEGVIAPQFQTGQKLPVMASFKFRNSGAFAPAVGSAFATGDAATTMSALYADPTPPGDWKERARLVRNGLPTDSTLRLTAAPTVDGAPFGATLQTTDVRPVFFGTDTSLGLKISWSGAAGTIPDSARFGYNRKELAFVPIAVTEAQAGDRKVWDLKMSSLMATIDSGITDLKLGGAPEIGYQHIQYFATGHAATLLSMQRDVRLAMLARLDPNKELQKKLFGGPEQAKSTAFILLNPIYDELRRRADKEGDDVAWSLADRLDTLAPPGLEIDFPNYEYADGALKRDGSKPALGDRPFRRLHTYIASLGLSIDTLQRALGDPALAKFNGEAIADKAALRATLEQDLKSMRNKYRSAIERIEQNGVIVRDAADHLFH